MSNDDKNNITPLHGRARRIPAPANDSPVHEPMFNLPPVVSMLALPAILIFIVLQFLPDDKVYDFIMSYGFIPAKISEGTVFDLPTLLSPLTHIFIHVDFLHLAVNLGTLLAFGAGLEKTMGAKRLVLFYFAGGLCGAFAHLLFYPHLAGPLIGASGAISALFGGILIMMQSHGAMGGGGIKRILPFVVIWIIVSVLFGFFGMPGVSESIGWAAHVGGFLGGLVLYIPIMRLKID